jgi:hypothetical protein
MPYTKKILVRAKKYLNRTENHHVWTQWDCELEESLLNPLTVAAINEAIEVAFLEGQQSQPTWKALQDGEERLHELLGPGVNL